MNRTYRFDFTPSGLNALADKLEEVKLGLMMTEQNTAERLALGTLMDASQSYAVAQYDGVNDVSMDMEQSGTNTFKVYADGASVAFIEFGTGVYNPDWGGGSLPDGVVPHGEYGKGYGKRRGWVYVGEPGTNGVTLDEIYDGGDPDKVLTHGNPANDCFYNAAYQVAWPERARIAEEELDSAVP